ncbi:TPA: DUF5065 family protein [Bacillus cereus]|nr:DUF5065 family protein [Bacillus cereus]HDR4891602.1 DUF5065 family protein [Bacillus cereus]
MKLGKLALAGALALGGFTGLAALDTKPAAAASNVQATVSYDDWGITNTSELYQFIPDLPYEYKQQFNYSYKTGDYFTIIGAYSNSLGSDDQIKIFRVADNGSGELTRYKTINWHTESALPGKAIWDTQITDNYDSGQYVAVAYLYGKHYKSGFFVINK